MDGEDIQTLIETNQPNVIEDLKKKCYEQFNATKDPWLLNGIFDCYIQTSSMRLVEILVGVREPHDVHLFNKLSETLRGQSKLKALTLLGHVVRRRPTWLIKITKHSVLSDLLRILKVETDILLLMSALLIIIILLPMIPSLMANHLTEIFDVFSRLAAWNTNNPNKVPEHNLIHLQVGLCELFNRLYGMYPCNFLYYLRQTYNQRENLDVFSHTIKPMVFSVRMHPQLVTTSKDAETAASRWMKMEDHDVIVECAKYVLDASRDDIGPLYGTPAIRTHSTVELAVALEKSQQFVAKSMASDLVLTYRGGSDVEFSPSVRCGLNTPPPPESTPTSIPHTPIQQNYAASVSFPSQEGTSPPEAAIEATPETTPIKDLRLLSRQPPAPSSVVRALNNSLSSGGSALPPKWPGGLSVSTSYSQPSSPMKKEPSPFRYSGINQQMTATPPPTFPSEAVSLSAFQQPRRDSLPIGSHVLIDQTSMSRRIAHIVQDRKQNSEGFVEKQPSASGAKPRGNALVNISTSTVAAGRLPSSPLRVIGSSGLPPESPVPIEPTAPVPGSRDWPITRPTPEKNGFHLTEGHQTHGSLYHQGDSSQEDQEIVEIVRQGEQYRNDSHPVNVQTPQSVSRHCDSVLQEFPVSHSHDQDCEMDGDECLQEQSGSPCASGGLHMPNVVMNFTRRAHRMRYFSQCLPSVHHQIMSDSNIGSTGSSPGNGTSFPTAKVRRTNSCPEIEKTPATDLKVDCTVEEREEFEDCLQTEDATTPQNSIGEEAMVNGYNHMQCRPEMVTEGTQTIECAPYEHLFMSVFPTMDAHASQAPSPAPISIHNENVLQAKPENVSPQAQLDHFLWNILENRPKSSSLETDSQESKLKEQIMLLNMQLQFERQRREVHAERNRRLLGRSRNNRALEELKTALKEQLSLVQHELESVNKEVVKQREDFTKRIQEQQAAVKYWEEQCIQAQDSVREWKTKFEDMEQKFLQELKSTAAVQKEYQNAQSKLLDVSNEKRQAEMSAAAAIRLRSEAQQLQRELFLAGEQQQRLCDKIQYLTLHHNRPEEFTSVKEAFHEELNTFRLVLDTKNSALEASKARVSELESTATNVALQMTEKKRQLKVVKDEYNDQLQSVESKYQAQKKINQRLQENNLELLKIIAEFKSKRKREGREPSASQPAAHSHHSHPKSPDSVCSDDRLPHSSSPLSESLSSSEGMSLPGILARDVPTIQNLQVIVDQPEHPVEAAASSPSTPTKVTASSSTASAANSAPADEG